MLAGAGQRFVRREEGQRGEHQTLVARGRAGDVGASGHNAEVVHETGVAGRELRFFIEAQGFGDRHGDEGDALGVPRRPSFGKVDCLAERYKNVADAVLGQSSK